jgi:hypothetical protein
MANDIYPNRVASSAQVALDAAADVWEFFPGKPVDIVRWGYCVSVVLGNTALVINADSQLVGAARGDGDVGTLTPAVATAVGLGAYTENVSPGVTAAPTTPFKLDAGEGVIFQVATGASSGDGTIWVEYHERPFVGDSNQTAAQGNRIAGMLQKTA